MLFAFIGLVAAFLAWQLSDRGVVNEYLKYLIFAIAAIFIMYDTYTYVILPEQIGQFYGSGTGLTYGNTTAFNQSDTRVAYFMSRTSNDWVNVENVFGVAMWIIPVVMLMLVIKWISETSWGGSKVR